jgi:ribosomal protein S18 acetylase RimI-like enzyme
MDFHYTAAVSDLELQGILSLQKENLQQHLDSLDQGFVMVCHQLADLQKMNAIAPHIICKSADKVVAYVLAMTKACKEDIPVLFPMFEQFDQLPYKGRMISAYDYMVVGQICVGKEYRGLGIFDGLYSEYKKRYQEKYPFAITEVATRNLRSMRAHERVGFKVVDRYLAPDGEEWAIVLWDWNSEA